MTKTVVLFDMDGTLTEPRKAFDNKLKSYLYEISEKAEIGIVSGSDYDYIREQMGSLIDTSHVRYKMHLLPCNGTKHYTPPKNNADVHELVFQTSMKREIGEDGFNQLVRLLIEKQLIFSHSLPCLSGTFIHYRGSMINWCPIGRSATPSERKAFVELDTSFSPSVRQKMRETIMSHREFCHLNMEIKLGGDTSFDIYPSGWDKTFALNRFPDYKVWFVGDRCHEGGNDKELYDLLKNEGRSFSTTGPEETMKIIQEKIIPNL